MNDRQLAIAISLLLHMCLFFVLMHIRFHHLPVKETYYEVDLAPLTPVQQPTVSPPEVPVLPHSAIPERPQIPPEKPTVTPRAEVKRLEEIVPPAPSEVIMTPEDSLAEFRKRLRAYFRNQYVIPFKGDLAAFMDYDPESLAAPRDEMERVQNFLEGRLAEMALSPEELNEIYPEDDIVGRQIKRMDGIVPTVPIPLGLLMKAAVELTKKAIGLFSESPDPQDALMELKEHEVIVLHNMWILGWAAVSPIYLNLPKGLPIHSEGLSALLARWTDLKIALKQERNGIALYYPAISRAKLLQFYLANLAAYHWDSTKDNPEGAEMRKSLIRKIAILNYISLAETTSSADSE